MWKILHSTRAVHKTTVVAKLKGAEVLDVQVTLSGASSTGWSQVSQIHMTSGLMVFLVRLTLK